MRSGFISSVHATSSPYLRRELPTCIDCFRPPSRSWLAPALVDNLGEVGVCEQVSNHLRAARDREFGKDPAQVCGYRPDTDRKGAGDSGIGATSGYHAGDLLLARAERNQSAGLVLDAEAPNVSDHGIKEYSAAVVGATGMQADHGHNLAKYILEPPKLLAAVALT